MNTESPAIPATILVVDDNPAGRYATSRVLRAGGFAVLEAATGSEGVTLAPGADLVVLDVNLPDISGFEVCRQIRSRRGTAYIPVIHLSATFVQDTDKVEGLQAGADGYLTHPVEPPVLIATVNAFLRARRAEDEMRKSEAKFKAIFDQALSGILLVSENLLCLEANPAMCQIVGRPREEILGRHMSSFVPAGHEKDTMAITREIEDRGSWRGTFALIRADGAHVETEWSIARYTVPGVRLAIVNDITERKAHEAERERLLAAERAARAEAERANRLKDEFLSTLSHELRTPLNAIVGWAHILKSGTRSEEDLEEGIDAIDRNAQSQSQLISDLLEVSRITSGKLRLNMRQIDAVRVIDTAIETIAPAYKAKAIQLDRALDPTAGAIEGDPDRIQQIVWNLMNNAVKFTPKGGTIRVSLTRENSCTVLTVSDNGQGIRADFLPHIFERFRQENASTRRNQGGLGLGLAIVKHLVEMHGGTIRALSEGEGRGATFIASLPISAIISPSDAEGEDKAISPATDGIAPPGAATVSLRGLRVLVVEDDSDSRAVLRHILKNAGAEVGEASDAQMALHQVAELEPNILISDVGMPDRDGYDLIRSIRQQSDPTKLPAIALTAFAREQDRERSLAAGFQLHLSKPINADQLLAAVASVARQAETS